MNTEIQIANNPAEMTFSNTLFYRFCDYTDVNKTTLQGYKVCLRQFGKWLQDNEITKPIRENIKQYKEYLAAQNFTAGTQAQYLRAVKHFFKWAASEGLYPNIADNIKGAKVQSDNTKKEAFTEEDIKTVIDSIETESQAGLRDKIMIVLSVTAGLRIIEMQRANVGDLQRIKGQTVLYIQGKGHAEKDDYVKIIPELEELIKVYLDMRKAKKHEPLFTGTSHKAPGARLTEPSISRLIKCRFKAAGFDCDKLTAHSLRHTSNTLLFKTGADLYTVQKHARHKDPKTTEIYIHAVDKEKDRSEQAIYNCIYAIKKDNPAKIASDLLLTLPYNEQLAALEYIKQLIADTEKKGAVI